MAVIASTADGRIAETQADLKAFKPFFLDFDPPSILTSGDDVQVPVTVRNYLDRAQTVKVKFPSNTLSVQTRRLEPNSSNNLTYLAHATETGQTHHRVIALAGKENDGIEKPIMVHPDGQEVRQMISDLVDRSSTLTWTIPTDAIGGTSTAELRLYPNVLSLLWESAGAILQTPHGCAEQTISAGYANLIALRYARAMGAQNTKIEKPALKNIDLAIEALSNFTDYAGGVSYWSAGDPDIAVTAYALSFLVDVQSIADVDKDEIEHAIDWLQKHQQKDGQWRSGESHDLSLTALVARSLATAKQAGYQTAEGTLQSAFRELARYADETPDPYTQALVATAAFNSGEEDELAHELVARLVASAQKDKDGTYWDLRTNTPFYGWGRAGRIETSALVVKALEYWRAKHSESADFDSTIRKGLLYLLRNHGSQGYWFSTQATMRVMEAIADSGISVAGASGILKLRVNGKPTQDVLIKGNSQSTDPILIDISRFLIAGQNRLEIVSTTPMGMLLAEVASNHWVPWESAQIQKSNELKLSVEYDTVETDIGKPIRYTVKAERVGFRGSGMMLAEIGIPPGADIDRPSLESLLDNGLLGIYQYEIQPDRVFFYLWPKAGGSVVQLYNSPTYGYES